MVKRVKDIANEINKAIIIAQSDVPGPVFVELPLDLLYPQDLVRELYGLNTDDQKRPWWMEKYLQRKFESYFQLALERHQNLCLKSPVRCPFPALCEKHREMMFNSKRPVLLVGSQTMLNVPEGR